MSVTFGERLNVSNGTATRLLRAVGYPVGESNDGWWPVGSMLAGIESAKVEPEDADHLTALKREVLRAQENGEGTFTWF